MNIKLVKNIILNGESQIVEFKTSFGKATIETIVAFSNTKGGRIIVGVSDSKEIVGVSVTEERKP